jgi:hypothetical protein
VSVPDANSAAKCGMAGSLIRAPHRRDL